MSNDELIQLMVNTLDDVLHMNASEDIGDYSGQIEAALALAEKHGFKPDSDTHKVTARSWTITKHGDGLLMMYTGPSQPPQTSQE